MPRGYTEWGPPNQTVLNPEAVGVQHGVGIGFSPKDHTLFAFSECCRMNMRWMVVSDPAEQYWACSKCRKPYKGITAGASKSVSLYEERNHVRVWVSKWIGRSMHDIVVDVSF